MQVELDRATIERYIPHRSPFLLLDRVIWLEPGKLGRAERGVSADDPLLAGHFPGRPVYPGVLILEGLGQLGALLTAEPVPEGETPSAEGKFFARLDRVRFVKPALAGDVVELEVKILKIFDGFVKAEGTARVRGEVVASAELTFTTGR